MARFLGTSTKEISDNMIETAKTAAGEYNITVVLKSASTVIAMPDGRVYVNTYGTSGMATAGKRRCFNRNNRKLCRPGYVPLRKRRKRRCGSCLKRKRRRGEKRQALYERNGYNSGDEFA